jgi:hypothetical protein
MSTSARAWVILLWSLLAVGCAGGARAAATSGGGAAWRRLQTEHVDLITDLPEADALTAATGLERTREALLRAAWSKLSSTRQTARLRVVALASGLDFERYFGRDLDGFHTGLNGDTIVLWGTPKHWERRERVTDVSTTSTFRHELVHHLAAGIYGRQPRWFAEGLAQFLETISIRDDGTKAALGLPNFAASRRYRATRALGVNDALAWGRPLAGENEVEVSGLYGLSWMMIAWMFNTQRDAFDAYQAALARGEDPARAWAASFGSWKLEDMDKALYQYALHGDVTVYNVDLAPADVKPTVAPLGAADVHALRAQLALLAAGMKKGRDRAFDEEAEREIAEALALEPGHVAALRLSHESRHPLSDAETLARVREQTRRRPDDGEAWLFLGSRLRRAADAAEREDALRKAVTLLPSQATADNALAWFLVQSGRGEEALPLATRASLRAPWNPAILDTYAASLFAVGRCPDALLVQARAVENLPEPTKGSAPARPYLDALHRYRQACGQEATTVP